MLERYDAARTGADRRRDLALLAAGRRLRRQGQRGDGISGYLFFRALPARVVIGPAIAESADMLAALVDGVAAACPGERAVIRASAAAPLVLGVRSIAAFSSITWGT